MSDAAELLEILLAKNSAVLARYHGGRAILRNPLNGRSGAFFLPEIDANQTNLEKQTTVAQVLCVPYYGEDGFAEDESGLYMYDPEFGEEVPAILYQDSYFVYPDGTLYFIETTRFECSDTEMYFRDDKPPIENEIYVD